MSDQFWNYFFGFCGVAFIAYMQYRTSAAVRDGTADTHGKLNQVMDQAHRSSEVLADNLTSIKNTTDGTHMLVNSAMGAQKKLLAVTARAKAAITEDQTDIAAAVAAETDLADHEKKQGALDAHQDNVNAAQINAIQKTGEDTNAKVTDLQKP
jgi:hypothetical protein